MDRNRRDLLVALSAFAAMGVVAAEGQTAGDGPVLAHSEFFSFDQLPVTTGANGAQTRPVLQGRLPTGEFLEVHETTMPPGQMPHPPHRHTHSEMMLVREGKLEVTSEGKRGMVEAGGIAFNASGVLHGVKSVGNVPAKYFVVAVGVQKAIV